MSTQFGPMVTFDGLLKNRYAADGIRRAMRHEINGLYEQMSSDLAQNFWGTVRHTDPVRLAGCKISEREPGTLTAAGVMAVTTFCALEWLRHRKAEVAAAEKSGDYTTLIDEFTEWLRNLFIEWRKALGLT